MRTDYAEPTNTLPDGILKNTNGTGQHTIAAKGDFPILDQDTKGTAANVTDIVTGAHGGTGINNSGKTISLGADFSMAGPDSVTLSTTGVTSITLPTSGTLATTDDVNTASGTNANLKGPITSVGNDTSVASQTGIGSTFVMNDSPTLITPDLGTPSKLIGTNIEGTAANLKAGHVTINADLDGEVTSSGNTTTVKNATVLGKVLTGFTRTSGAITDTDNILQAIEKLDGNLAAGVIDATATDKGIIQLAGDLSGTALAPKVTGINGTSLASLSTGILKNANTTGIPSIATMRTDYAEPTTTLPTGILKNTNGTGQHTIAVKEDFPILNQNTTGTAANVTDIVTGAHGGTGINNGIHTITLTGDFVMAGPDTVTLSTTGETSVTLPKSGTLATIEDIAAGTPDASSLNKGKIQLAGDLTGTAAAPEVKDVAVTAKLLTGFSSGSGTVGPTDSILSAIQKLDGNLAAGVIDASTTAKGKIQLAGDLAGTATAPQVTDAAVLGRTLTGFSSGAGTVGPADSILSAIGKLNGNITGLVGGGTIANLTYASNSSSATISAGSTTNAIIPTVTSSAGTNLAGLMNPADKAKLDTITLGGNLTTTGPYNTTFAATANTSVTLPTTGTLATLAGVETLTNKTLTGNAAGTSTIAGFNSVVNTVAGTAYTLTQGDNGKVINFTSNSAIALTIPAALAAGFNCLIVQYGAGAITLTASGTTVVNKYSYTKTAGQYSIVTIVSPVANVFITSGNMN